LEIPNSQSKINHHENLLLSTIQLVACTGLCWETLPGMGSVFVPGSIAISSIWFNNVVTKANSKKGNDSRTIKPTVAKAYIGRLAPISAKADAKLTTIVINQTII